MECAKVSYPKNYILYILCSAHVYLIIVRHVCKTFVFLKYTAVTTMPNYANGISLIKALTLILLCDTTQTELLL